MRLGFDEVGRGALAGPVVVSLVAIPESWPLKVYAKASEKERVQMAKISEILSKVNDSKKLRKEVREAIAEWVHETHVHAVVLQGSNITIDTFGIGKVLSHLLAISLELMAQKIDTNTPLKAYIDGRIKFIKLDPDLIEALLKENNLETQVNTDILTQQLKTDLLSGFEKFILVREDKADGTYLPVALASNVAKVYRDNLMAQLSEVYPDFGWGQNVGYGTKLHREAIQRNPFNPLLRKTWLKNILEKR